MTGKQETGFRAVSFESKPTLGKLLKLWKCVFTSAPAACGIYLGLYLVLSLLRPALALIWGEYTETVSALSMGGQIFWALLMLAGYWLINFVCGLLNRYLVPMEEIERLDVVQNNRIQELFISKVYAKIARMLPEYFEVPQTNDRIEHMVSFFSESWQGLSGKVMMQSYVVAAKLVSVISIALTLGIFNPYLSLIVIAALLPTLYTRLLAGKLRFKFVKDTQELTRRAEYFQRIMLGEGAREMKIFNLHGYLFGKWKEAADEYAKTEARMQRNEALINISSGLLSNLSSVGANVFAIVLFSTGRMALGALSGTMTLISTLLTDTDMFIGALAEFLSARNEAAVFDDFMALSEQQGESQDTPIETLEIRNLKYRYPGTDQYVIDGLSLTVKRGEHIALVGENGAGKSTLIKLMAGILTPTEGEIRINGIKMEAETRARFRSGFSAIAQEPAHYTTFTVGENVFLGDTAREPDAQKVKASLQFAGLENLDVQMELGKDVGGTDLSGGQWQKLAIARSVYRGRDFVLLDEPTASLDPMAESEVFQKYMEIARGKSMVVVTHRISAAALAQRVIVLSDGKIAEDGPYEALLKQNGPFARLHREQAQWYAR